MGGSKKPFSIRNTITKAQQAGTSSTSQVDGVVFADANKTVMGLITTLQ